MYVYIYSIHSLDVLRLILNYFYLICAILFVIIGLMKGGGSAPLSPFRGNTALVLLCTCVNKLTVLTIQWVHSVICHRNAINFHHILYG